VTGATGVIGATDGTDGTGGSTATVESKSELESELKISFRLELELDEFVSAMLFIDNYFNVGINTIWNVWFGINHM
jgi:hypothetical protein